MKLYDQILFHEKWAQGSVFLIVDCPCTSCYPNLVILYSWWLPIKWMHPVSLIKHKNLSIAVVVMKEKINHCPLLQVSCWNYSGFTVENISFAQIPQFPCSQKCFPVFSELCKDTSRKCCTIYWKDVRGECFECWLSYLWKLPWLGETVLSGDFPAISGKQPVFFFPENLKTWPKLLL